MTASPTGPGRMEFYSALVESVEDIVRGDPSGQEFLDRLTVHAPFVVGLLSEIYGERDDFPSVVEAAVTTAARAWLARKPELRILDRYRLEQPLWFQSQEMVAAMGYVDRFGGDLAGVRRRLDHVASLGVNYLHLMPPYLTPPGHSDGGYAVSSYRKVDPALGTVEELEALADDLRVRGISLALDVVVNHTADDHEWARAAQDGDSRHVGFYFVFPDRELPDAYEQNLREIFPEQRPGSFTYVDDVGWVWTTFHSYQWDLDYSNPDVFVAMSDELLHLANLGAEVLRLDAVPFIWKQLGTACENLPQTHTIIRAFYQLTRLAAPGTILKSEAIVHPEDVVRFLGEGEWAGKECQIAYHPLLMVELWEALATGWTRLLCASMRDRFAPPEGTAWVNYLRSHDDIGWGFADEDAESIGIHAFWHRQFLNRFYTGEEPGSWALGLPFQFNPETHDMRISGTTAALAGLERAVGENDPGAIELALSRIMLMYGIVMSIGGIPLIYLGDEIAMLNDATYSGDDSRWAHRPSFDWERATQAELDPNSVPGRILHGLRKMIRTRKHVADFRAPVPVEVLDLGNHVFGFRKGSVVVAGNFTPEPQAVTLPAGVDMLSGELFGGDELGPYDCVWVQPVDE